MNFGLPPAWRGRPPVMPTHPTAPMHIAPNYQASPMARSNPIAAMAEQRRLQELKRQDELRRVALMRQQPPQSRWRGQPPAQTIIYQQAPAAVAPVTPVAPTVVTATPVPDVVVPPSMPSPQPDVSQGTTQDLGPTQDAAAASQASDAADAAAAAAPTPEHPVHSIGRKVIIGLVVVGVAAGGYMLYKKSKSGGGRGHKGLEGYRRRSKRRRR